MHKLWMILSLFGAPLALQDAAPELTISHVPAIGVIRTVSVGTTIHEYARTYSFDAYVPTIEMKGGRYLLPLIVPANTALLRVPSKAKLKACVQDGPCGLDDDGDGIFDRMAQDDFATALKLKRPVPYERRRLERDSPDSLKQIMIYEGASKDTLRISYREFSNNFARPAFTEDLTIPIGMAFPQDVAVKAVKIRIHRIDGLGMTYEILP